MAGTSVIEDCNSNSRGGTSQLAGPRRVISYSADNLLRVLIYKGVKYG